MAGAATLAGLLLCRPAAAQEGAPSSASSTKVECARAFEQSQRLRNAARYLEANREVLKCTHPACGTALSEECGKIHAELQAATPSVVFSARDDSGQELTHVGVVVDGAPITFAIDGKPVPIDPGSHTFTFAADGYEAQTQRVVVRAAEHFRSIGVTLRSRRTEGNELPEPGLGKAPGSVSPPLGSYVLGGVAALGLGGFVGLRLWGARDFAALERDCKPSCSSSSVDAVKQKYLLSNVALAVGGAAAIAAVTVYWVSPKMSGRAAMLQVSPSGGGISARIAAPF